METKTLTVMFADLAGYTSKTSKSSREKFVKLLDTYEQIVEPVFEEFHGEIVKRLGDGYLVAFESPTNAVLCGIKMQDNLFKHNRSVDISDILRVKIAISMGEVFIREHDVYGEPVNIASRIEDKARPRDVYFDGAVYLSMNKNEIPCMFIGAKKLKGIPRPVKVFKVLGEYSKILMKRKKRKQMKKKAFWVFMVIMALLAAAIGMAAYLALSYGLI
ncbi:adenylate/guanylate cyclase domain-containing protein [Candidatus Woesearchaeota archaeon]|nr:adenylate/guanylate cyclase domain-containing protein [Candidatus Woesearchaeota archaeon]MBW3017381.1 adenylate/guanylate cyclase domain-containing protein [Candidatus Woesearchaeota archaeon]